MKYTKENVIGKTYKLGSSYINCEKDYNNKWKDKPWGFLRKTYDKVLIPNIVEQHEAAIIGDVDDVIAYMKSYLQLKGS